MTREHATCGSRAGLSWLTGAAASEPLPPITPAAAEQVGALLPLVTACDCPLVVRGETGTGREALSRWIHRQSSRCAGPLVVFNCATVPVQKLGSRLFGESQLTAGQGGLVHQASGGTLVLKGVELLPWRVQLRLLQLMEEASADGAAEVRVIGCSASDLQQQVELGGFRRDLLLRLQVIELQLPPLRARPQLIAALALELLGRRQRALGEGPERLAQQTQQLLVDYPFPGNVRELVNVIEHAAVVCRGRVVEPAELPAYVLRQSRSPALCALRDRAAS